MGVNGGTDRLPVFLLLLLTLACDKPKDNPDTYILSQNEIALLPDTYKEGDTLAFLYTTPSSTDTQRYVVGKVKSYTSSYVMPKYGLVGKFETLELPIIALGRQIDLSLAVGNKSNNRHGGVQFWVGTGLVPLGEMSGANQDTTYRLRNSYNLMDTTSVLLTYSPFDGIKLLTGTNPLFRLERIN